MQDIHKCLEKINNTSLAKVIFFKGKLQDLIDSLNWYNIVFAKNGIFVAIKNKFAVSIGKIEDLKYTNSSLSELPDITLVTFIPKPNISIFVEILEMFKYVSSKKDLELCVNVYYNKKTNKFQSIIIKQTIDRASVDYKLDETDQSFEMSDDFIRYLQIHSHNTMAANFSSKDNEDERNNMFCFYGVVGKIDSDSKFYDVDMKFRIWNGFRFVQIAFEDVFDIGSTDYQLDKNTKNKLDDIIKLSASKQLQRAKNFKSITADILEQINEHNRIF